MNKVDTISTAFAVVHTQKEIEKLESKIFNVLEEVQLIEGPAGRVGKQGPKGDKGVKGDKGDKGERGERGADGNDGAPGPVGEKGDTGGRGEQGEQGLQGIAGIAGKDGERGERGEQGPQGLKGDKGDKGDRGPQGNVGPTGKTGKQGKTGAVGAKGDVGPQGPKGVKGDKGDTGLRGEKGERGERGEQGPQGIQGEAGPDYKERFEEALEAFNKQLTENKNTVTANLEKQIQQINRSLSTLGGGGSYKIVDNADVDKSAIKNLVDDAVLIYDPTKKKFVAQSFLSILDRLKADLEVQYDRLVDTDGDYTYIGEAVPGTARDASTWRIKRVYEQGDDLEIIWADNTADFVKVWDDRATYEYN